MNDNRKKLPLKLTFGILAVLLVMAFSMSTTTSTLAQQAATPTPAQIITATPDQSQSATATPAPAQTQAPGTSDVIPVTGQNTARSAAFARAVARLSNVSDNNLEDRYNEALAKLRKQERMLNSANNKFDQFTRQLGKSAFSTNQNQNDLNTSDKRNRRMQAIQENYMTFTRNLAVARQQVLLAQIALNSSAGFDVDGNLINREAAINALAVAETSLSRGMAAMKQIDETGDSNFGRFLRRTAE